MRSAINYFLDESGNTGDLAVVSGRLNFGGQPIFVLSGIGLHNLEGATAEIERLKVRHGIQAPELKSANVTNKPDFVLDLISYLRAADVPLFIEVMDKRYTICINIVQAHVLLPAGELDAKSEVVAMRNFVAEYLYEYISDEALQRFVSACTAHSKDAVRSSLEGLAAWLSGRPDDGFSLELLYAVTHNLVEFDQDTQHSDKAHLAFLPIPDDSKTGKPIWMLPNLSSFTNIYARINKYHHRALNEVILYHDEQLHFDSILNDGKISAETLYGRGKGLLPFTPHADYRFTEQATLAFAKSSETVGIQIADVIAGFTMRFLKEGIEKGPAQSEATNAAFAALVELSTSGNTGINFVLPTSLMRRLGIGSW